MTQVMSVLRRALRPLASRKVRVALATVIAAFAADRGLKVSDDLVFTILGVGAALILGIAHEDAGKFSGGMDLEQDVSVARNDRVVKP